MSQRALVIAVAAAALSTSGGWQAALAQDASVLRGERLVKRHCGGCHAAGRTGRSREPAAPPLRNLHQRYEPEFLAEALSEGLLTGHRAMPEFRFGDRDLRSIILYLDSIQTRHAG